MRAIIRARSPRGGCRVLVRTGRVDCSYEWGEPCPAAGGVRETTARVLASGLVGEPVVTPAAGLWHAELVDALRERPEATVDLVRRVCPDGLLVARLDLALHGAGGAVAGLGVHGRLPRPPGPRDRGAGSAGLPMVATG